MQTVCLSFEILIQCIFNRLKLETLLGSHISLYLECSVITIDLED